MYLLYSNSIELTYLTIFIKEHSLKLSLNTYMLQNNTLWERPPSVLFYVPLHILVTMCLTTGRSRLSDKVKTSFLHYSGFVCLSSFIGKAIPLKAWTDPEGSRRLRLPDFKTVGP
jgi:hypothetical protein